MEKKGKVIKKLVLSLAILLGSVSMVYAAVECNIDTSSSGWVQADQATWVSGIKQLTVHCKEDGVPVVGYQAQFDISLMEGATWQNKIATLTVYSTPTDNNGTGYINVPLIHLQKEDGDYIHICPFDDIQCTGGVSQQQSSIQSSKSMIAIGQPRQSTTGCTNTNILPGCCETTITVTCCSPIRTFTYCTTTASCVAGTTSPDFCTTITTTYSSDGICNYCTGICEPPTIIELVSLQAIKSKSKVTVLWETASETDNAGFNILRSDHKDGDYVKINSALIPAQGSPIQGASYEFVDTSVENRRVYYYKLEDVDFDGTVTTNGPAKATPRFFYGLFK